MSPCQDRKGENRNFHLESLHGNIPHQGNERANRLPVLESVACAELLSCFVFFSLFGNLERAAKKSSPAEGEHMAGKPTEDRRREKQAAIQAKVSSV